MLLDIDATNMAMAAQGGARRSTSIARVGPLFGRSQCSHVHVKVGLNVSNWPLTSSRRHAPLQSREVAIGSTRPRCDIQIHEWQTFDSRP
jgi:hypothetical protein